MATAALFGSSSGLGGSSGGNKHLVEFRAGRMTLKGRMVHPDKRKGLLYVYQGEDSLMHFCWKDRTTGEVEDDLLIFPDDCEFVRVNECTTGRVYVLKFKSFSKKYFFWLQEPKTDKDDEYCRRINETLNNPPTSGGRSGGGGGAQDGELQNLLNNMSQQQLMQLFGGVGQIGGLSSLLGTMGNTGSSGGASSRTSGALGRGSSTGRAGDTRASSRGRDTPSAPPAATAAAAATPAAAAATTEAAPPSTTTTTSQSGQSKPSGQIFLSDLQRYFSGLGTAPPGMSGEATGAAGGQSGGTVELGAALSSPSAVAAAEQPQHEARLTPHLPGDPPQDDVRTTLLSPQFAQAANLFSTGLTSGQMGPVISQFGLGAEATAAATTGNMEAFLKAIENNAAADDKGAAPKKDDKPKDEKKDDGDDGMSVD